MVESYAWRLEAAIWRKRQDIQVGGEMRCKPRLLLVFDRNWYSHGTYTDEYEIYGYIEHYPVKPERWLVHYFPIDARGLDATHHHEVGSRGRPLHEGEKCEPRDTAKDAAKYLLDLATDELQIAEQDHDPLFIVSADFLDLLKKLNDRYLRRYLKEAG